MKSREVEISIPSSKSLCTFNTSIKGLAIPLLIDNNCSSYTIVFLFTQVEQKLLKVTIDNITVEVEPGTTILMAARKIGGDVVPPAMCYYSKLEGSGGKCRTCLVEVSKGSEKDPRPMPKLVASCRTTVMDGMEVKSMTSEKVIDARKGVLPNILA